MIEGLTHPHVRLHAASFASTEVCCAVENQPEVRLAKQPRASPWSTDAAGVAALRAAVPPPLREHHERTADQDRGEQVGRPTGSEVGAARSDSNDGPAHAATATWIAGRWPVINQTVIGNTPNTTVVWRAWPLGKLANATPVSGASGRPPPTSAFIATSRINATAVDEDDRVGRTHVRSRRVVLVDAFDGGIAEIAEIGDSSRIWLRDHVGCVMTTAARRRCAWSGPLPRLPTTLRHPPGRRADRPEHRADLCSAHLVTAGETRHQPAGLPDAQLQPPRALTGLTSARPPWRGAPSEVTTPSLRRRTGPSREDRTRRWTMSTARGPSTHRSIVTGSPVDAATSRTASPRSWSAMSRRRGAASSAPMERLWTSAGCFRAPPTPSRWSMPAVRRARASSERPRRRGSRCRSPRARLRDGCRDPRHRTRCEPRGRGRRARRHSYPRRTG